MFEPLMQKALPAAASFMNSLRLIRSFITITFLAFVVERLAKRRHFAGLRQILSSIR